MSLSNEAVALLKMIALKPQGRVSYALLRRDEVMEFARPLLEARYIKGRRLGFDEGFQITTQGRLYLAGAAE